MKKILALLGMLALTSLPARAVTLNGSLTAAGPTISTCSSPGDSVATLELSGTWTGTITLNTSLAQSTWVALPNIYAYGSTTAAAVTTNGLYQAPVSGGVCVQVSGASLTGTVGVRLTTAGGSLAVRPKTGTVTGVTASAPLASSGGAAPNLSLTGIVPVANGGTGSATQNFVDLTTNQTIAGIKTFSSPPVMSGASITAGTVPNNALVTAAVTAVTGSGNISSSGGTTPNITLAAAPAISGANITAGTVPYAALASNPTATTCASWTPTDNSGGALTLTVNSAKYCVSGVSGSPRQAIAQFDITYPTTLDTHTSSITIPVNAFSGIFQSGVCGYGTSVGQLIGAVTSGTGIAFVTAAGVSITNNALTGARIVGCVLNYVTAT